MEEFLFRTEKNGAPVLALDSGLQEDAFAKSGRASSIKEKGILLSPEGEESEWELLGTACREESGTVVFYGADFKGESLLSLAEAAAELSPRDNRKLELWKRFVKFASSIYSCENARKAFAAAGPAAVLCGADGSLLVLPTGIFADCVSSLPEEERFVLLETWVHPYFGTGGGKKKVSAEKAFTFAVGCLARKILAGEHPFSVPQEKPSKIKEEKSEKPIREDFGALVSGKCFVPAKHAVYGIGSEAAETLDALLTGDGTSAIIDRFFTLCGEIPIDCKLPSQQDAGGSADEEAAFRAFNAKFSAEKERLQKKFLARKAAKMHRTAILVTVLCTAVAAAIGLSIAENIKNRPTTAGLEPFQVVEGFYQAIASLDQEIPRTYASGGAEKRYTDMTSTMYVSQRMIQAYSLESAWITPAAFYAAAEDGLLTLEQTHIYGITRFEAEETARSADMAEYRVSFFLWIPVPGSESGQEAEDTSEIPLAIYACADRVNLVFNEKKARWAICEIESEQWSVLAVSGKEIAEDAANRAQTGFSQLPFAPDSESIEIERNRQERLKV